MPLTNFSLLTNDQKKAWSLDFWEQARNQSFISKFLGKGPNSLVQHITELSKSEKGAQAVITLLADLEGDGVAGDRTLEGNEEAMKSYDQVIKIDMLRDAVRHEGRMAEQKSVVSFRNYARDRLSYWLADRIDQLAFLTLAGLLYTVKNSGGTRTGSDFRNLEFATTSADAPTSKRVAQWDDTNGLVIGGGSSAIIAGDTPCWEMFVQAKAYAKETYMRGIMVNGEETYHAFLSPSAMAKLKLDVTYRDNLRYAQQRGTGNELFTGSSVKVDGIYLHEFRHVPNTRTAAPGTKYGGGSVEGCQVLFCGAQALAMADIGDAEWNEKEFDYGNQPGISVGKILGFLKPKFTSQYNAGTTEDFGVLSIYTAQ